jgi:ankyrin repeat protein
MDEFYAALHGAKWPELEKILTKTKPDLNQRDKTGTYPIQYLVEAGQDKIVKIAVTMCGTHLDVVDEDGRSLLYRPIRYHKNGMVTTILALNKDIVGVSLLHIADNTGRSPLHWAAKWKNTDALEQLITAGAHVDATDNRNYSPLHIATLDKHLPSVEILLTGGAYPSCKTSRGETPLHLATELGITDICNRLIQENADLDAQEIELELSPLHIAVELQSREIILILLDGGADVDLQGLAGDTALHIAAHNGSWELVDLLLLRNADLNLVNIEGKTPAHILMAAERWDTVAGILSQLNINLIDYEGRTPLYYLIHSGHWHEWREQLISLSPDVGKVLRYTGKKTLRELITKDKISDFMKLLEDSWYYRLTHNEAKWPEAWMSECKKDEAKCRAKIKTELKQGHLFIETMPIEIPTGDKIVFGTFTGGTFDIACGLLYLLQRWDDATTLSRSPIHNPELAAMYRERNIHHLDVLGVQVVWAYGKLYMPIDAGKGAEEFLRTMSVRYLIVPLAIETTTGAHANYLVFDKDTGTLERFEPHGVTARGKLNYHPNELDRELVKAFTPLLPGLRFLPPSGYSPRIGFQLFDNFERKQRSISDPGGFCAIWAILWVFLRLSYRHFDQTELIKRFVDRIRHEKLSFRAVIRDFSARVTDLRDKLLVKRDLDINAWINTRYTKEQFRDLSSDYEQQFRSAIHT